MSIQEVKVYVGVDIASSNLDLFDPSTGKSQRDVRHGTQRQCAINPMHGYAGCNSVQPEDQSLLRASEIKGQRIQSRDRRLHEEGQPYTELPH